MRHWTWRNFACVWVCVCVRRLVWQAKLIIIRRACSKSNNFACFITPALTHAYTTQTPTRSHTHKHIRRDMYICEPDMLACCNKIRLTTNRAICSAWWDFVRFFFIVLCPPLPFTICHPLCDFCCNFSFVVAIHFSGAHKVDVDDPCRCMLACTLKYPHTHTHSHTCMHLYFPLFQLCYICN